MLMLLANQSEAGTIWDIILGCRQLCERIKAVTNLKVGMSESVIWVNEQIDPCGIVYSCIACCNEQQAQECHASFEANLSDEQKAAGWVARLRTVKSWDEVPVSALKLN